MKNTFKVSNGGMEAAVSNANWSLLCKLRGLKYAWTRILIPIALVAAIAFAACDTGGTGGTSTSYTVTFSANGGSGTPPPAQTAAAGSSITLPSGSGLTRDGYAFGGWNASAAGTGTNYAAGSSYAVSGNITLYAKWIAAGTAAYTVTFHLNGGSGTPPGAQTAADGSSITLPGGGGLTRDGYTFGGWNTSASGTGTNYAAGQSYTVSGNITLYAKWNSAGTSASYTVTFSANGGTGTAPPAQTVNADDGITLPSGSGLARIGFVFVGWNTSAAGTGTTYAAGQSYTVSGNITLYAKWEDGATTYTVTFSANNGDGAAPGHQIVTVGSSITIPNGNALSRDGFTFGGWNTNASGTGTTYAVGDSYTVTGDATLYAKWDGITYTVTFDSNGGSGTVAPMLAQANSSITLPNGNALSRTYYTFGGWNANASGTGTNYDAGDSYTVSRDVTLYARWINYTGPVEMDMVFVPGGSFEMGTASGGESNERPVHTVTLTGFYMGKYEVTQLQYEAVMGTNPSYFTGGNLPVERVTWYEAVAFCNALSEREGLTKAYTISGSTVTPNWSANGYRLPTEAEWEYAAKGGNGSPGNYTYSGSNTIDDVAWYSSNSGSSTHAVGTKAPNELGIYDMSGNVYEWCWDWYGSYSSEAQTDPAGASSGSYRVYRGGSWFITAEYVRAAYRIDGDPSFWYYIVGFRVVRP